MTAKLKPCPFCGDSMVFIRNRLKNRDGKEYTEQYWMHDNEESDCILDQICMPFTIGAGDAKVDAQGNPLTVGEYGELWNRRVYGG